MAHYLWDRVASVWRPVGVWVYREGEALDVVPAVGHEAEMLPYSLAVDWARHHDFPDELTWHYWTQEFRGHPYMEDHMSEPYEVMADSPGAAAQLALQKLLQPAG